MLLEVYETPSKKPVTKIKLSWSTGLNEDTPAWNEICEWAIQQYGLPGHKFEWHPDEEFMEFDFFDEKDAIHFMLRWS